MKGWSNGGSSSLVYGTAIAAIAIWVAILFACLAMTAEAGSSRHELLSKQVGRSDTTRAVYVASSRSNATRAYYHTEEDCLEDLDDETKTKLVTLIFCTKRCRCHSNRKDDVCYCCQPGQGCYDKLEDCRANCPACSPTCPDGTTTADGQQLHSTKNATL